KFAPPAYQRLLCWALHLLVVFVDTLFKPDRDLVGLKAAHDAPHGGVVHRFAVVPIQPDVPAALLNPFDEPDAGAKRVQQIIGELKVELLHLGRVAPKIGVLIDVDIHQPGATLDEVEHKTREEAAVKGAD